MSDPEMETWSEVWSADETSTREIDVAKAIHRHQMRSSLKLAANVVFGFILIGGSLVVARLMHSREIVVWAVVVWMATLVALFLALMGWRKERITPTETVRDYAAIFQRKALADRWRARTAALLLLILFCISCAWLTADVFFHRMEYPQYGKAIEFLVLVSVMWGGGLLWLWNRSNVVLKNMAADESEDALITSING
ncbi:MAG TPA: hypothetical protein VM554_01300 [Acidisarcina sp.]|nr:hypothetical protein [Acidisarcina sp.]